MDKLEFDRQIRNISPQDYMSVLRYAQKFQKINLNIEDKQRIIKIAILGTCSIQYFVMVLKLWLYKNGIICDVYEGEYNGIRMDVLDNESLFYTFNPELVIILSDYRDIKSFPRAFATDDEIQSLIAMTLEEYKILWKKIKTNLPACKVFQSNFVIPIERKLGNLEANYSFSDQNFYRKLNMAFTEQHLQHVLIIDMDYMASNIGKLEWFDNTAYMLNKSPFSFKVIGIVTDFIVHQILACIGKIRKCLVLDLDDTLWGGVVAEEGWNGIKVDPNEAVGEAFLSFQRYLLGLKNRGIILAICSKNDCEIAEEPFHKNNNMILKREDFSAFKANWNDKATNIQDISRDLKIGVDSMVFFDDNPAERELVRLNLPEVYVIDVPPEPADYTRALELSSIFDWLQITSEDYQRVQTYADNKKRDALAYSFVNYDEYLRALDMHGMVQEVTFGTVERFTQLLNKSNQFNMRTQRYSDGHIHDMMLKNDYKLLTVSLRDKFSNYGIISCIILKKEDNACFIDTWVMSCRVLKRGIEFMSFQKVLNQSIQWECEYIYGEYIPTIKNDIVRNFYLDLGFEEVKDSKFKTAINSRNYRYDIHKIPNMKIYIEEEL